MEKLIYYLINKSIKKIQSPIIYLIDKDKRHIMI